MPKYHLALDLYRKVRVEYAGLYGYVLHHTRFKFPFGKGETFKNWKEAEKAARYYWKRHAGQTTEITVSRLSNAGNGFGRTVFVAEALFAKNFEFPPPYHYQLQGTSSGDEARAHNPM